MSGQPGATRGVTLRRVEGLTILCRHGFETETWFSAIAHLRLEGFLGQGQGTLDGPGGPIIRQPFRGRIPTLGFAFPPTIVFGERFSGRSFWALIHDSGGSLAKAHEVMTRYRSGRLIELT